MGRWSAVEAEERPTFSASASDARWWKVTIVTEQYVTVVMSQLHPLATAVDYLSFPYYLQVTRPSTLCGIFEGYPLMNLADVPSGSALHRLCTAYANDSTISIAIYYGAGKPTGGGELRACTRSGIVYQ